MDKKDAVPVIPAVIVPKRLGDYLEVMTRAVFQAGVTWKQIAEHWGAYRRAFVDFHCERVAAFTDADIERALMEPGLLRSEKKMQATVHNARTLCAINSEWGSKEASDVTGFQKYLRSFPDYHTLAKNFHKRFKFMGEMNVWYVLFRTGEAVPEFESWVPTIKGDHPRMREMVEQAHIR